MPKFSIIIPVHENEHLTKKCLDSIRKYTEDYEIIIIDNGSLNPWYGPEKIIYNKENLGFPVSVNQGIKEASGDVIVILNNDVTVTPNWLYYLNKHLQNFDIVGPCTNSISGPQQVKVEQYQNDKELNIQVNKFHKENNGKAIPYHRLVFFCVAIKKEVIGEIGLLDEQFSPGNFEDDDFCLRAIESGFKLGIAQDVFIHHEGSATHKSLNIDFKKLKEINLAKFKAKWPENEQLILQGQALNNCIEYKTKKKLPIALVMIVKNEEKGLEKAILSCRDFVSEIFIAVDNSSSDKTTEIAKKYATTLKFFDWQDDFSAARNLAQEGVKSDWILFIDGHEVVKKCENLEKALTNKTAGLLVSVELDSGAVIRSPRIYKNGVKFAGKIHEQPILKDVIPYSDFIIKHDRIGSQTEQAKEERKKQTNDMVPRIMGEQLRQNPENIRASFHLALNCQSNGQFKKAIKYQKIYFKYAKIKGERWFVYFNMALNYLALRKYFKAFSTTMKADEETPNRWEIEKLRGMIFFAKKRYGRALEYLVDSFHTNTGDVTFKPWQRDDAGTWNLIGECFFNLGNYFKASIAFDRAAEICTDEKFKVLYKKRANLLMKMAEEK